MNWQTDELVNHQNENLAIRRWRRWAARLQQWGMADIAATWLEAASPWLAVGAQMVYLSEPVLSLLFERQSLTALALLLEDPSRQAQFATWLQREKVAE